MERIIVIGAGQAASSLMVKLRSQGFEGDIVLIGEEPHLPYQRPPLSKKYLAGEMPRERLLLFQLAPARQRHDAGCDGWSKSPVFQ